MAVYYNEIDDAAVAWLRELMTAKVIPHGEIDTRSIVDVRPADLRGFRQCHFFAGIGGWAYALRLAGWPDDRDVWTGSCPCQPFSMAGKGEGIDDPRHLWPAWRVLIRERRPRTVFGEQTASQDGDYWIDLVQAAMEEDDFAFGKVDLPAAGVGAPQRRQRLWFVADDNRAGQRQQRRELSEDGHPQSGPDADGRGEPRPRTLASATGRRRGERRLGATRGAATGQGPRDIGTDARGIVGGSAGEGLEGQPGLWASGSGREGSAVERAGPTCGFWFPVDWLPCRDGKARPVEPGAFPLAHGIPARVGRLRGYGNAIVPQVAAEVITAYMESRGIR